SLQLGANKIGPAGVEAIACSSHFSRLTLLDLHDNPMGLAGARALARSPYLGRLTQLNVSESDLGGQGMELLRRRFGDAVSSMSPTGPVLKISEIFGFPDLPDPPEQQRRSQM